MIRFFSILQSLIAASRIPAIDGDHPHVDCCTELILQKTTQYPEAQGNYILRPDLYAGFPVYAKMTGNYYIYMHETYQNWHLWTEIGSMYSGFFAHGGDTKCPSEAIWKEMIHGKWVNLPDDALTCNPHPTHDYTTTPFTTTTTTTTTETDTLTTTTRPSDENHEYYEWVTQGFLIKYQKGTPDEIWDLIVRDLKWIQDKLHSKLNNSFGHFNHISLLMTS